MNEMEVNGNSLMSESLPKPKRNAVSFVVDNNERPKLSKAKSFRPSKMKNELSHMISSPTKITSKPANNQDEEEDEFARADSDDSDDYDGLPPTEEVPMICPVVPLDRDKIDKMDITLERNSRSSNIDQNEINDLPITQTVEDSQLVKPAATMVDLKLSNRQKAPTQAFRKINSEELTDACNLSLPKTKAVSFINKSRDNYMILEAIEESPSSRPHQRIEESKDLNFGLLANLSPTHQMDVDDDEEDGLP